jgi:uncharacterized protein YciI
VRVAYVYSMRREADRIRRVAPRHAAYWNALRLARYEGPFADRSGGLITFETDSVEAAERLVAADPFVRDRLLDTSLLKQWAPADQTSVSEH